MGSVWVLGAQKDHGAPRSCPSCGFNMEKIVILGRPSGTMLLMPKRHDARRIVAKTQQRLLGCWLHSWEPLGAPGS